MALLKVLLLLGLGVLVNSDVSLQKRIIGGRKCADKERPYQVRLEITNRRGRTICGGSLIHPQWVLSAAHCWMSKTRRLDVVVIKFYPRSGEDKSHIVTQDPVLYTDDRRPHGIMLLKLRKPVTSVPLARLPDCSNFLKLDSAVQLAGEGAPLTRPLNHLLPSPAIPTHLQCVDMKVVQTSRYRIRYGYVFTIRALNKDSCFGDSGAAAVFNHMIYGVLLDAVWERPVYILDVCGYIRWIKARTGLK